MHLSTELLIVGFWKGRGVFWEVLEFDRIDIIALLIKLYSLRILSSMKKNNLLECWRHAFVAFDGGVEVAKRKNPCKYLFKQKHVKNKTIDR